MGHFSSERNRFQLPIYQICGFKNCGVNPAFEWAAYNTAI